MKSRDVIVAIALVVLVIFASCYRYASPIPTTQAGAIATLKQVEEWVKWLTQIQLAALGVLLFILLDKDSLRIRSHSRSTQTVAVSGLISLSTSVFLSSWLLSALISQSVRINAVAADNKASTFYDVYELPAFGWLNWPTLGNLISTVHWLWAAGLLGLAVTVIALLVGARTIPANSASNT